MLTLNRLPVAPQVTDAANEARDNIKYLATLEHSLEPLYTGSPAEMAETLPSLLGSIRMMHTIARFYSQPARMTAFLQKVSLGYHGFFLPGDLPSATNQLPSAALDLSSKV